MSSDNESTGKGESPTKSDKKALVFTEKEELVLKAAWRCLKSGPPEIDIERLTKAAGFNTQKTAANTWGVIKKKLFSDVDGNPLVVAPATPKATKGKKGTATSAKKRAKKNVDDDEDDDDDEGKSIAKKNKPSPVKKRIIKAEDSDDE